MNRAIVTEQIVSCRADSCSLWPVVTDTDRLNRAVGMERVEFAPLADESAARYLGATRMGGFDVAYEERPYEWVYLRRFGVERRMRSGPVSTLEMSFELEPTPSGGTDVRLRLSLTPRLRFLIPIIKYRASRSLKRIHDEIRRIDEAVASGNGAPPVHQRGAVDEPALRQAHAALEQVASPEIAGRLVELVRSAPDIDVSRIRPYELAAAWGVDRRLLLVTCLSAVRAGLLELSWEVVCPSCRTAASTIPSLAELGEHGGCQLCDLEFAIDLDEAVEATFAPAAAVRRFDRGPYCSGGPARTPHVVSQSILPSAGEATLTVPTEANHYRLFVRGGSAIPVEVSEEATPSLRVVAGAVSSSQLQVKPGGEITVVNDSAIEKHVKLEHASWPKLAATAREVTSLPAFRRDFSADTLKPGLALKVSRVAIFFSDLTGSTQLYSTVGDAAAFRLVQSHFDLVLEIIERRGGTVVKTIGDAVMSVFADELDSVEASVDILRAFEPFRRQHPDNELTHIKLGVYAGPAFVVTANKILDYFGQSVNIAARLQGEAKSGELVLEASLADRAVREGRLDAGSIAERWSARLKGVDAPVEVARIRVVAPALGQAISALPE